MRGLRLTALLLIASMVALTILYFDDPWLWRRFTNTFIYMAGDQPDLLKPNEPVAGDGSL